MELDPSRFRRSIRLEASYRVLQDQRLRQAREMRHMSAPRQVLVWLCSFFETASVAAVPAVHLVTGPYLSLALLLLMSGLSCLRAHSVLDLNLGRQRRRRDLFQLLP